MDLESNWKLMKKKTAKRKLTKKETGQGKKIAVVPPDDVVFDILLRLPARSVGRFRCVSKSWLSITTHSTFVRAHSQRRRATGQSLVIDRPGRGERFYLASAVAPAGITLCKLNVPLESSIRASCDGLLCLWSFPIQKHRILNLLTGRSVIIPANTRLHTRLFLAFYFHPSAFEYRLLAAAEDETSMQLVVGENAWKHISCRLPAFCNHSYTADLNASLHWLAWKQKPPTSISGRCTPPPDIIMSFDKDAEVYGLLSLPPPEKLRDRGSNLVNFNGKLGMWVADNFGIDFWVMDECWVKNYSVNYVDACGSFTMLEVRPGLAWLPGVAVSVGDEELFADVSVSETLHYLVRWNLKSGACLVRIWKTIYPRVITTFSYMESLFGPNSS